MTSAISRAPQMLVHIYKIHKIKSHPLIEQPESDKEELKTLMLCDYCDLNLRIKNNEEII